jgi:hypothetical protein
MPYLQINPRILEKVKAIKIIKTPEGEAPEWVRKEWVGLTLPIANNAPLRIFVKGVLGGGDVKDLEKHLYPISGKKAFSALQNKSPEAFQWWERNSNPTNHTHLIFHSEHCEAIYY